MDPYYALACAVVEQAMWELRTGTPKQRKKVAGEIAAGCLDYWIHQVAGDEEMLRRINEKLAEVVKEVA